MYLDCSFEEDPNTRARQKVNAEHKLVIDLFKGARDADRARPASNRAVLLESSPIQTRQRRGKASRSFTHCIVNLAMYKDNSSF